MWRVCWMLLGSPYWCTVDGQTQRVGVLASLGGMTAGARGHEINDHNGWYNDVLSDLRCRRALFDWTPTSSVIVPSAGYT